MKWQDTAGLTCPVARTLSVIGDRWTFLIVRNAFLGMRRFEQFQANLGVTRHVLSDRLGRLVDEGILARLPYQQRPLRHDYALTEKGSALYRVLLTLADWGNNWMPPDAGPGLKLRHTACGKVFSPVVVCSECHAPVALEDIARAEAHQAP